MSRLLYMSRVEKDKVYYINNNYDPKSLSNIHQDIVEARKVLDALEKEVLSQYQKASRCVEYKRVVIERDLDSNKKVLIVVKLQKYLVYEGVEVKSNLEYQTVKKFTYKQINEAQQYARDLLQDYPGSKLVNTTGYKLIKLKKYLRK